MRSATVLLVPALAFGCAPADVAGDYTVDLTLGDNDCGFGIWTGPPPDYADVGETTSGIGMLVTQDDDQVQLEIGAVAGVFLDFDVGGSRFDGQVSGNDITAALIGDVTARMGECVFTRTIDLEATVAGDFIAGELLWRPVTNGHRDCGLVLGVSEPLDTCSNRQVFNGSRPSADL